MSRLLSEPPPLRLDGIRDVHTGFGKFREEVSKTFFDWALKPRRGGAFHWRVHRRAFDNIVFAEALFDPMEGKRGAAQMNASSDDWIAMTLCLSGRMAFAHEGRETDVGQHDLLLWDGLRHGWVVCDEPTHSLTIFIRRVIVRQHIGDVLQLCGRKIGTGCGTHSILASHLRQLHETFHLVPGASRISLVRATLDVVAACFHPEGMLLATTDHQRRLLACVETYIRGNIGDDRLTASAVAGHFGFSDRYLRRLFTDAGTSFSDYLRTDRLSRAARSLASPAFSAQSITQIAQRFGFRDSSHFGHAFKAAYGLSPRAYRARELPEARTRRQRELAELRAAARRPATSP